jgi:hypothetical protein
MRKIYYGQLRKKDNDFYEYLFDNYFFKNNNKFIAKNDPYIERTENEILKIYSAETADLIPYFAKKVVYNFNFLKNAVIVLALSNAVLFYLLLR